MYVKIAYMETTKKASGLKEGLEMPMKKDIGISSAKRERNITSGTSIKGVLKTNKGDEINE